jgi:hypothetical protein
MVRLLLGVVSACLLLAIQAAAAEDAKFVKLRNAATGKVLAVADNSEESGAKIVAAKDDSKNESQQWKLEKDGDHIKVVNRKSGKVLDVAQESKDEGGEIIQWDDKAEGNDNQRWAWEGEGKKRRLKSKSSGLVLDVDDDGNVVQRASAEKANAQLWEVVEVAK